MCNQNYIQFFNLAYGNIELIFKVFPDLSYNDAFAETKFSKLGERWEKLSGDLFSNIVKNDNHKLAYLLPPKIQNNRYSEN